MISAQVSCDTGVRNKPFSKIVLRGTRAELGTIAEGIIGALSERNFDGAVGEHCEAEIEIQRPRAKKEGTTS